MQTSTTSSPNLIPALLSGEDPRVARILARSIFRDMKSSGIPQEKILEVASELIGLVTADLSTADLPQPA